MALELLPALGELGDLGLINNLSGISLGSCRRRTWSPFYYKICTNDLSITFLLIQKVIDKSGTGQAAATGLINNLSTDNFPGILIEKLAKAVVT